MKIWKQVGGAWRGYGNGFKAVIYGDNEAAQVRVYKGDRFIADASKPNIPSAKRWAEKNYLKGTP